LLDRYKSECRRTLSAAKVYRTEVFFHVPARTGMIKSLYLAVGSPGWARRILEQEENRRSRATSQGHLLDDKDSKVIASATGPKPIFRRLACKHVLTRIPVRTALNLPPTPTFTSSTHPTSTPPPPQRHHSTPSAPSPPNPVAPANIL